MSLIKNKIKLLVFPSLILFFLFSNFLVSAQGVSFTFTSETVPASLEPGENGNLILTITNSGSTSADNVRLNFQPNQFIALQQTSYDLQSLSAGKSVQIVVPLTVSNSVTEGITSLSFSINYLDSGFTKTVQNYVPISINTRSLIEIKNVTYSKEIISRGNTVDMNVTFQDVGEGKIKDLIVSMKNFTLPFVPAETDTESFVGDVDLSTERTVTFKIIINLDAETKAYSIPISFSYFDQLGNPRSDVKHVGLKISGTPEFIVTVDKTENLFTGSLGKITLSVANRGTATAQFLTTFFNTSNVSFTPGENYVGNLDPDDTTTVTYDISLAGKSPGTYQIPLVLSYKDPYNQESNVSQIIEFQVTQKPLEIPVLYSVLIVLFVLGILYWKRNAIFRRK